MVGLGSCCNSLGFRDLGFRVLGFRDIRRKTLGRKGYELGSQGSTLNRVLDAGVHGFRIGWIGL